MGRAGQATDIGRLAQAGRGRFVSRSVPLVLEVPMGLREKATFCEAIRARRVVFAAASRLFLGSHRVTPSSLAENSE